VTHFGTKLTISLFFSLRKWKFKIKKTYMVIYIKGKI